tara:strand:- start:457 stop:1014 length:558 start_codon:yes stop_codon:yes gene_type:complete
MKKTDISYTKTQQLALKSLSSLAMGFDNKSSVQLTQTEVTEIKNTLGIDLEKITVPEKIVKRFVRGKSSTMLKISKWYKGGVPYTENRYFEFQIAEVKHDHFDFGKIKTWDEILREGFKSGEVKSKNQLYIESKENWIKCGFNKLKPVKVHYEQMLVTATRAVRKAEIELEVINDIQAEFDNQLF